VVNRAGAPIRIILSEDRQQALAGADVVITQLRVGQMAARREDEYLGRRHGLVGQETTGIGGMSKALRTIPVILEICDQIQQVAPGALLLNFSNPSGLIMEAIQRYAPHIKAAGVCNSAFTTNMKILQQLSTQHGVTYQAEDGELLTLGLNHLTWHSGFKLKGEDVWDEVFNGYVQQLRTMSEPPFHPDFIEKQRVIPNDYLEYYFQTAKKVALQKKWPPSRAEEVMQVEKDLLAQYADPACDTIPVELMQRGGAYYSSVAASMIDAYWNDLGETHIANVTHNGQVKGWEKEWVLEMPCRVDRSGVQPLPTQPLPLYNYALLEQVKQYELLTVEAAVHGDRAAAFRALLAHPLGPDEDQAGVLLEDMLSTHRRYLPRFFL
jgi:6-phospho-beta-glucosidase